jgi:hypothetical protein
LTREKERAEKIMYHSVIERQGKMKIEEKLVLTGCLAQENNGAECSISRRIKE